MMRAVLGFVLGVAIWMPAFFALAILGNLVWSEYASHAQTWFEQNVFTFPAPMAAYNAVCWAAAELVAGWAAAAVARRREPAWILAAAIGLYMGSMHLWLYWPVFPWWYNLAVALPAAPAVLLGGMAAGRFAEARPPAVAS
jgi:hypothetical protein